MLFRWYLLPPHGGTADPRARPADAVDPRQDSANKSPEKLRLQRALSESGFILSSGKRPRPRLYIANDSLPIHKYWSCKQKEVNEQRIKPKPDSTTWPNDHFRLLLEDTADFSHRSRRNRNCAFVAGSSSMEQTSMLCRGATSHSVIHINTVQTQPSVGHWTTPMGSRGYVLWWRRPHWKSSARQELWVQLYLRDSRSKNSP